MKLLVERREVRAGIILALYASVERISTAKKPNVAHHGDAN